MSRPTTSMEFGMETLEARRLLSVAPPGILIDRVTHKDSAARASRTPASRSSAPPSHFKVAAKTPFSVTLRWTNAANEQSVTLEQLNPSTQKWGNLANVSPDQSTFTVRGLTEATTYDFRISANRSTGSSAAVALRVKTLSTIPPRIPKSNVTFVDVPIELPVEAYNNPSHAGATDVFAGSSVLFFDELTGRISFANGPIPDSPHTVGVTGTVGHVGTKFIFAGGFWFPSSKYAGPLDAVNIYDTSTGLWSSAQLAEARGDMSEITVGRKAIFTGGDFGGSGGGFRTLSSDVDIYDDATGQWSHTSLSAPGNPFTGVIGDNVYFQASLNFNAPGENRKIDVYNTKTDSWTTILIPHANAVQSMHVVGNQLVLLEAIDIDEARHSRLLSDSYNTGTGKWSTAELGAGGFGASIAVVGNELIVAGGDAETGTQEAISTGPSNVVRIYNSVTGIWTVSTMPVYMDHFQNFVVGGKAFFVRSLGVDVDVYDMATRRWSTLQLPNAGLAGYSPTPPQVTGDHAYFVGFSIFSEYPTLYNRADRLSIVPAKSQAPPQISVPAVGAVISKSPINLAWSSTPGATLYDVSIDGIHSISGTDNVVSKLDLNLSAGSHDIQVFAHIGRKIVPGPIGRFTITV